jgi:hypothetical protein
MPKTIRLVGMPIITQATVERMIHLISVVLGELDVEVVVSKTYDFYTGINQLSRELRPQLSWPPTSDITHEKSGWPRILLPATPNVSSSEFPDRDG